MDEQEKRIREPEEEKAKVPEGMAASILKKLGEVIPGMRELVEGLEKSEVFRERLEAIDKEIETRLRNEPLKKTKKGVSSFQSGFSRGAALRSIPRVRRQRTIRIKPEANTSMEPPVDVFDEETHLRVLAELPGVEEKDIKVTLNKDQLIISINTPSHKYYREITLPYAPKGQVNKSYRNGVLELTLQKE